MRVLHLNAGNETGGGMVHILSLLTELTKKEDRYILGLFEKGMFYDKAVTAGIETVTFEQSSRYDLSVLSNIIRFIKEEKIDMIHTHGARANLYGYFLHKFTKATWVTTVHSDPRNDFLGRGALGKIFTKLNLAVLKKPDHYFAISKRFKEMLIEFGIAPEKITVILNGIDFKIEKSRPVTREEFKVSAEDFVVVMIARFDPVKRHDLAIAAIEKFSAGQPGTKLLLVGDGPIKGEMEELVQQKGLLEHVRFLGFREDIDAIIRISDVTLLTSTTESFPLVLLESSREKVPAITTDVGGVRDMIPDPSYSIVLDNGDVKEIVDALEQMLKLKNTHKIRQMGEHFYEYTSMRFSVQAFADSVFEVYQTLKK